MSEVLVTDEEIAASHAAFAITEYGERLNRSVRFGKFKTPGVSNEEWVQLLGADVNNLEHMAVTRGLARQFVRETNSFEPGRIAPEDGELLVVSASAHDRGESIKGDIPYHQKTAADVDAEQAAFEAHLSQWGITSPRMLQVTKRAIREVIFDTTSPVGNMLSAVEHVGYVRTALRACDHIAEGKVRHTLDRGLRWLAAESLMTAVPVLVAHAQHFPAVHRYLTAEQQRISTGFELVQAVHNFWPYQREATKMRAAFWKVYDAWEGDFVTQAGVAF